MADYRFETKDKGWALYMSSTAELVVLQLQTEGSSKAIAMMFSPEYARDLAAELIKEAERVEHGAGGASAKA